MTLTVLCQNQDCQAPMEFEIDPGHEPYRTQNPNHFLFSDPGSGPEILSGSFKCPQCGDVMDEDYVLEAANEQ